MTPQPVHPQPALTPIPRKGCGGCATAPACILYQAGTAAAPLLEEAIREQAFAQADVVCTQGVISSRIAVIKVGTLLGIRSSPEGESVPVALFGRGRMLGAGGLLGQANALGTRAVSAGRLCVVDIAELYRQGATDRQFLDWAYTKFNENVGLLADWALVMRVKGLQRQLLFALQLIAKEQGSKSIRLPGQAVLAALLSTTRESIARGLIQLEQQGQLVRSDRWHCEITA